MNDVLWLLLFLAGDFMLGIAVAHVLKSQHSWEDEHPYVSRSHMQVVTMPDGSKYTRESEGS